MKDYHPSRVLTLVYQPFALGTMSILAYNESRIDTRKRNLAGYALFTASTFFLIVVSTQLSSSVPFHYVVVFSFPFHGLSFTF